MNSKKHYLFIASSSQEEKINKYIDWKYQWILRQIRKIDEFYHEYL